MSAHDWWFAEDRGLALDRHEVWVELESPRRLQLLQAGDGSGGHPGGATLPRMPRPAPAQARRSRVRAQRRKEHRLRRFAFLTLVAVLTAITLALTAFDDGAHERVAGIVPAPAADLLPAGRPQPTAVATLNGLRIQLPIAAERVTAIGYHGAGDGALALEPIGRQGNQGLLGRLARRILGSGNSDLVWYQLARGAGPETSGLDVGAAPGTDVYAPVHGTIVGITPYVLGGKRFGSRIDIQPTTAPSLVLFVKQVRARSGLSVGEEVTAATTRIGTLIDLSGAERQALARFTNDAGNHVSLEAHLSATLALP
jgi:hypothetical protein